MTPTPRIGKLISAISLLDLDAVLINHEMDVRYLTGYPAHDAWLLVTRRGGFYITDGRYIEEVKKGLRGFALIQFKDSIFRKVMACCAKAGVCRLGVDERRLTVEQYKRLKAFSNKKISLVPANGCVDALRALKGPDELKLIRQAIKLNLKAYRLIKPRLKPGVREIDILHHLEGFYP